MARPCRICAHPDRAEIDRALIAGEPFRDVAKRFGTSASSAYRHKADHLPAVLVEAERRQRDAHGDGLLAQVAEQRAEENAYGVDLRRELGRCFERVNKLFDAADAWLTDPDDPSRYTLDPRADDVEVIHWTTDPAGRPTRERTKLSALLDRLKDEGVVVDRWETKHADPRELILKTANRLQGQLELVAKLVGDLDERPVVNLTLSAEWHTVRTALLATLAGYPDARLAVAEKLANLEVARGHRD